MSANNLFINCLAEFNRNVTKSDDNNNVSKCVKRLLSTLQSVSKKISVNDNSCELSSESNDNVIKCLTKLQDIVLSENSFAETSVLSGLAIAFLLNIYLLDTKRAIHLFFKLFTKQSIVSIDLNEYQIDNDLNDVFHSSLDSNDLTKVSLLSALLSCSYFVEFIVSFETKLLPQIHRHIMNVCSHRLIHQFHVFKLIQYWFRAFGAHINELAEREPNLLADKSLMSATLDQIDHNWEHPVNGVKDCIKTIYNLVLETFTNFKVKLARTHPDTSVPYDLISEELVKTSQLSFTSKAKYRKYSALMPFIGWQTVLDIDPNLSSQILKYLSINSLSTSINELYKSILLSMKKSNPNDLLNVWSKHFLDHICAALKSKNKVIHNNLIAHLLPSTLTLVDYSTQTIYEAIRGSPIAEVALVRTAVDHNLAKDFSLPSSWLITILVDSEEIVREEGLCLLIDERYVTDRNNVFELFKLFLLSNLNIDNPSFRQKIISKIERFLMKICISLSDKFALHGAYDDSDLKAIQFLKDFARITTSNMISGASYQKRMTCLLLFEILLTNLAKHNRNFGEHLDLNEIYFIIMLSIIDKDDKVRKMSSNVMIKFCQTFGRQLDVNINTIAEIGVTFVNSPRHQESHSGGLIMKYLFNYFPTFDTKDRKISNQLEMIEWFVREAQQQLSSAKEDLLFSAKYSPIHGFILAINNCLSQEFVNQFSLENSFVSVVNESINLCFDCIDLMLSRLSNSSLDSSPSFQEMCESLETVISGQSSEQTDFDDISMSNEFQLLLSLCWLNIKECSFLLANWVHFCQQLNQTIINTSTLNRIGSQLIAILSKCRHKGVIEATCIALTKYTVALIETKTDKAKLNHILSQLLKDSLNCITRSAVNTNITRRSAGIALTIQAMLAGEAEAFEQGYKMETSLFSQTVATLVRTAQLALPQAIDFKTDLPQTYSLHILKSIVSTASLSRFTVNEVEHLLPVCIKGFSSDIWQIRNASLQLFGACCCRMLGQRKTTDVDQSMVEGSTITYSELFSRYPTLLSTFNKQFEKSFQKLESGYLSPELVPVLSLFASFSPINYGQPFTDRQTITYLIKLLANKIWKIRMLSAKAMTSLLAIPQLEQLLSSLASNERLDCNSIHGLLLAVKHLLQLKQQNKDIDYQSSKDKFETRFRQMIGRNNKCFALNDTFQEVFEGISLPLEMSDQEFNGKEYLNTTECKTEEFLSSIQSKVEFTQSDDIRLCAAKTLNLKIDRLLEQIDCEPFERLLKLIDIVLIVLEDEDRTVRSEAEIIASKILNSDETICHSISFNVAIDCLLMSLVNNNAIGGQTLANYLFDKLESVTTLADLFVSEAQFSEVLFEREDKNVFAQPLFVMSKVAECLKQLVSRNRVNVDITHWKRLLDDCRLCLQYRPQLELKSLIGFSIWKLPKLFIALNSIFLRLDIVLHSLADNCNPIHVCTQSLKHLELCDHLSAESVSPESSETQLMTESYNFLLNKFNFLSFIQQNSLSGYWLIRETQLNSN